MIYITGTSGSIGSYVQDRLLRAKMSYRLLRRHEDRYDMTELKDYPSTVPLIIHLGSVTPANTTNADAKCYIKNISVVDHMISDCEKLGVAPRIIYASSMSVYHPSRRIQRIYESSPLTQSNPYGESKVACERLLEAAYKKDTLHSYVGLRLPGVLAPRSAQASKNFLSRVIRDAYHGHKINASNPDFEYANCLSVLDLCDFIKILLHADYLPCCNVNLSCEHGAKLSAIVSYILELLNSKSVVSWSYSQTEPFSIDISTAKSMGFKPMTVFNAIKSHINSHWHI